MTVRDCASPFCRVQDPDNARIPRQRVGTQKFECPVVGDRPVYAIELELVGIETGVVAKVPVGSRPSR